MLVYRYVHLKAGGELGRAEPLFLAAAGAEVLGVVLVTRLVELGSTVAALNE